MAHQLLSRADAMTWNLKQLRELVEHRFGALQRALLTPCLESLFDRRYYASFHYQESQKFIAEISANKQSDGQLFELVIPNDVHVPDGFFWKRKKAEAHIVACMQSVHSIADILGHVIYYALGMNVQESMKLKPRNVSIASVYRRLGSRIAPDLTAAISSLIKHDDYKYVEAIVNHSKHRSIVGTCFLVDAPNGAVPRCSLEFQSFEFNESRYPPREIGVFIEHEYRRQDALVISIGKMLNQTYIG